MSSFLNAPFHCRCRSGLNLYIERFKTKHPQLYFERLPYNMGCMVYITFEGKPPTYMWLIHRKPSSNCPSSSGTARFSWCKILHQQAGQFWRFSFRRAWTQCSCKMGKVMWDLLRQWRCCLLCTVKFRQDQIDSEVSHHVLEYGYYGFEKMTTKIWNQNSSCRGGFKRHGGMPQCPSCWHWWHGYPKPVLHYNVKRVPSSSLEDGYDIKTEANKTSQIYTNFGNSGCIIHGTILWQTQTPRVLCKVHKIGQWLPHNCVKLRLGSVHRFSIVHFSANLPFMVG